MEFTILSLFPYTYIPAHCDLSFAPSPSHVSFLGLLYIRSPSVFLTWLIFVRTGRRGLQVLYRGIQNNLVQKHVGNNLAMKIAQNNLVR